MSSKNISIRGAREHNLKSVDLELPREKLIVITGLSGSGKSSLAFDTIYAEGQRRYVESPVGLCAPVPGDDAEAGRGPYRGSVTGHLHRAEDHQPQSALHRRHRHRDLRLHAAAVRARRRALFAGHRICPSRARPSARWSTGCSGWTRQARVSTCWRRSCAAARASTARNSPSCMKKGFQRVKIDGQFYEIAEAPALDKKFKHDIDVVVDRLVVRPTSPRAWPIHSRPR